MTRYRAPAFWWRRRSLAGLALSPLGSAYGRVSGRRMAAGPGVSVGVPIICVGNLVIGGAGKTPTAIEVANVCRQLRLNPGFLSRGYGGREAGPVLVSHAIHTASDVGDEPLLLARHAPTVVAADRPSGAKLLASIGVDVIIMDDGFQNPSLAKDLSLIVIDAARGIGNGFIFPAGPLRGPAAEIAPGPEGAGAAVVPSLTGGARLPLIARRPPIVSPCESWSAPPRRLSRHSPGARSHCSTSASSSLSDTR